MSSGGTGFKEGIVYFPLLQQFSRCAFSLLSTTLNGSEGKRSFLHDSSLAKETCTELKLKSQRESQSP